MYSFILQFIVRRVSDTTRSTNHLPHQPLFTSSNLESTIHKLGNDHSKRMTISRLRRTKNIPATQPKESKRSKFLCRRFDRRSTPLPPHEINLVDHGVALSYAHVRYFSQEKLTFSSDRTETPTFPCAFPYLRIITVNFQLRISVLVQRTTIEGELSNNHGPVPLSRQPSLRIRIYTCQCVSLNAVGFRAIHGTRKL